LKRIVNMPHWLVLQLYVRSLCLISIIVRNLRLSNSQFQAETSLYIMKNDCFLIQHHIETLVLTLSSRS